MSSLASRLSKIETALAKQQATLSPEAEELLADIRRDPAQIFVKAGVTPDPWQAQTLRSDADRVLILATRQGGKSLTSAGLALRSAFLESPALILLLSPTLRQSKELLVDKVMKLFNALGRPIGVVHETKTELHLANGSRIISLPESESGIRGFSGVRALVVDEASRVADSLYRAIRPMLAVSNGRLIALSTPWGRLGWFFSAYESNERWERVRITAAECPRIRADFLREEYAALGERAYRREYECDFSDAIDSVFAFGDIQAAMRDDVEPLFGDEVDEEGEAI